MEAVNGGTIPMRFNTTAALIAGALALSGALAGCATKEFVRQEVGGVDAKVSAADAQVAAAKARIAAHDAMLAGLDKTSREALERAAAAGKLAEGKFLYAMVLSDDGVKFPLDSAALSPEAQQRLQAFADKLKGENRNVYLEIQGHTDATGSAAANMRLGEERAEAVRLFMNKQGVALNRMNTISYGEEAPVADNKTRAGRAQNRRVVVIVLS
jgi:outer membrane protein OmpA-like peptidoglycan-associated protein